MSTFFLVNKVRLGVRTLLPGAPINDAVDDTAAIEAAGGRLYPSANATVAAAAALAQSLALRGQHDQAAGIMLAAASKADALGADTATADNATPAIVNATATNQNTTAENLAEQRSGHVRYTNPPAADLVSIVTTLDPVADGALVLVSQPVVPCKLQVRIIDANNSVTGTVTLTGVGASGQGVTQAIPLTGGTRTVATTDAYATLTSAVVSSTAGAAAGDSVSIGVAADLGLPAARSPAPAGFIVYKASVDDVNEAVGTVDATAGTISPTTAPDGVHDFDFWYRYTVTVGQLAHGHVQDAHGHTQAAHPHAITLT